MKILENAKNKSLILIFGLGTVGSAILHKINSQTFWKTVTYPYPWDNKAISERENFWQSLQQLILKRSSDANVKLDIVWSAGKAGMSSNKESTELEMKLYSQMIDAIRVLENIPNVSIQINLISSIGALFEDIRGIKKSTKINPRSPYGKLKENQELALHTLSNTSSISYRLSSVFDCYQDGRRNGLIPTILRSAQEYKSVNIWGKLTTLRDYVWNQDIANYIVNRLEREHSREHQVEYLASGKPTSIREVLSLVEFITGRHVLFQNTVGNLHNDLDITVSPKVLPKEFNVTPLKTAIYLASQRRTLASLGSELACPYH